jgi:hypothetical protein
MRNKHINRINIQAGGFPAFLVFLIFLLLKLTGVIDWSWFFITMPLWIGLAIVAFVFLSYVCAVYIRLAFKQIFGKSTLTKPTKRK